MVQTQWRSSSKNRDWLKFREVYAPRPDIAVGPFNTFPRDRAEKGKIKIEKVFKKYQSYFDKLLEKSNFNENQNPRCLLAIEIKGSNTGKHMIGNFINASILGKIGLVIIDKNNKRVWQDAERVIEFLRGASAHKKIPGITKNTMLCEYSLFMDGLDKARNKARSI